MSGNLESCYSCRLCMIYSFFHIFFSILHTLFGITIQCSRSVTLYRFVTTHNTCQNNRAQYLKFASAPSKNGSALIFKKYYFYKKYLKTPYFLPIHAFCCLKALTFLVSRPLNMLCTTVKGGFRTCGKSTRTLFTNLHGVISHVIKLSMK